MFWFTMLAVIALDQLSKYLITSHLALGQGMTVIPGFLDFTYVLNDGASFSLFQGQRIVFLIITVLVLALIFGGLRKIPQEMKLFRFLLALFCGGAIGNFIDRLYQGAVVDFVNLGWFPVFNLADSCLSVSAVLICLMLLFGKPGHLLDKKKEIEK
ncbi:MAG: signal peptidase II [Clostridia bacterium]|nr:signal peptidase II [Clostridia bacterium]